MDVNSTKTSEDRSRQYPGTRTFVLADQTDDGVSLETDTNASSRKRRKISAEVGLEVSNEVDASWLQQLEVAAAGSGQSQVVDATQQTTPKLDEDSRFNKDATVLSPAPRRTPRKATETSTDSSLQASTNVGKAASAEKSQNALPTRAPPKRKTMKISANGRLVTSPDVRQSHTMRSPRGQKGHKISPKELKIVLRYGKSAAGGSNTGSKIEKILSGPREKNNASTNVNESWKITHPFFLGQIVPKFVLKSSLSTSETSTKDQESDRERGTSPKSQQPVAWKDLGFANKQQVFVKAADSISPPWPPRAMHKIGAETQPTLTIELPSKSYGPTIKKAKGRPTSVPREDDILLRYSESLAKLRHPTLSTLRVPTRVVKEGAQAVRNTGSSIEDHPAISRIKSLLPVASTAFELGKAEDNDNWVARYAPARAEEVLQPNATAVRNWLQTLTVSTVQRIKEQKVQQPLTRPTRKKRRRKIPNELDNFIATSDDEPDEYSSDVRNAVLICGPPGCGKTASVFAVATELGFEVFEIHPGMRRNAKDIFDKVGDMTQNHLVQGPGKLEDVAGNSTVQDIDPAISGSDAAEQGNLKNLFSTKNNQGKGRTSGRGTVSADVLKKVNSQKQSLILIEEVDVLFDEDRGFWSGVIALISQSKRPVILTCNDESCVPSEEVILHATYHYQAPPAGLATEYLLSLAANEGHLLDRDMIQNLYKSKHEDLRATIMDLDFWCQMAIGSQKGGLDWMLGEQDLGDHTGMADTQLRVFSKDTYVTSLGMLLDTESLSSAEGQEKTLRHANDLLEIPVSSWYENSVEDGAFAIASQLQDPADRLQHAELTSLWFDARSALDLMDSDIAAGFSAAIHVALRPGTVQVTASDVVGAFFATPEHNQLDRDQLLDAFQPMMIEKPIFPPAQGRLAPSFDRPNSVIAADIAPYLRSIIAFDQRLEQQRDMLVGGLEGKKIRKTRAARAAVEGGSKASTRRERWFPELADFEKILSTGGKRWTSLRGPDDQQASFVTSTATSPASEASPSQDSEDLMVLTG